MSKILRSLVILSLLQPAVAAFAASPAFDQAVQQYKARQYSAALPGFLSVLKANPADAMTHYYLALCYQGMNQVGLAKQQYEWVASCNNATLRSYASTGLANLSKIRSTYSGGGSLASSAPASSGGGRKISGRLKVLEFYADW